MHPKGLFVDWLKYFHAGDRFANPDLPGHSFGSASSRAFLIQKFSPMSAGCGHLDGLDDGPCALSSERGSIFPTNPASSHIMHKQGSLETLHDHITSRHFGMSQNCPDTREFPLSSCDREDASSSLLWLLPASGRLEAPGPGSHAPVRSRVTVRSSVPLGHSPWRLPSGQSS